MGRKAKPPRGFSQREDSGIWQLLVYVKGKRKRISLGTKYLSEAIEQAKIERAKLKEKEHLVEDESNETLYQFFKTYEAWHVPPIKSWTTVEKERAVIKVVKEQYWTEDLPLTDITVSMCKDLFTELGKRTAPILGSEERKPITKETLNLYLVVMRAVFKEAKERKLILTNPFMEVRRYKKIKKRPRILSAAEQEKFFAAVYSQYPRYADLFMFYLWTGLRRCEALNLKWENIDFENGFINIMGKGEKIRSVPFFERTRRLLEARREKQLITPFSDAPKPSTVSQAFKTIVRMAGFDAKLHDLRKTCGTEMASKGVHGFMLKQWLGHVDDETTIGGYIGLIDEETKEKMDTLGTAKLDQFTEISKEVEKTKEEEKKLREKELAKEKRMRNKEKIAQQKKEFYEKHRDRLNAERRKNREERENNDEGKAA